MYVYTSIQPHDDNEIRRNEKKKKYLYIYLSVTEIKKKKLNKKEQ